MAASTTVKRLVNAEEVRRAYKLLVEPGQVVEIRALEATTNGSAKWATTYSGYFDNADSLLTAIQTIRSAFGVYITLQPCKVDLMARAYNRLKQQTKTTKTTSDTDTTRYTWLPVDCDPERPSEISSTDEEHEQALIHACFIREELHKLGWPAPVLADSGNGAHLLYKVDLAVAQSDLVKRVLEGLAARYDSERVHVDRTLFNPSRIIKLYGTLACKGDDISERPHRMSRLLEVPDELQPVSRELLERIATPEQETKQQAPAKQQQQRSRTKTSEQSSVTNQLDTWKVEYQPPRQEEGKTVIVLKDGCVFDPSHKGKDAAVIVQPDGTRGYHCFHDSCADKGWHEFRLHFEPDYEEKQRKKSGDGDEDETVALRLVRLAEPFIAVFCDRAGDRYAKVNYDNHVETMPLTEKGTFRRWLHNLYETEYGRIPNSTALTDAIHTLEARAQFRTKRREQVYLRVAYIEETNTIYLDMANEAYQVIEVNEQGWKVLDQSPVNFRRTGSMTPLPVPARDGDINKLRPFINCSDTDWVLIKAWLVGCLQPSGEGYGEYAILNLNGGQGAAKTSAAQRLRSIIDPSIAPLRKPPKDAQTFAIMAHNNFVVGLDNLSHISGDLSDSMCTLSTGAGDAYRKHYSNDEEMVFASKRPQIFTGIEQLATRGDLIDRSILVTLLDISEEQRKDSTTLNAEFKDVHPLILGGLLDCVALALKQRKQIQMKKKPRLADFAMFVVAAEPLIGNKGEFVKAYDENRKEGVASELEASLVASAVRKLMGGSFDTRTYNPTDLLAALTEIAGEGVAHSKGWPKSARGLSSQLKRLARSLQIVDIHIKFHRHDIERLITLSKGKQAGGDDAKLPADDAKLPADDAKLPADDAKQSAFASSDFDATGQFTPPMTQNDAKFSSFCIAEKKEKSVAKNTDDPLLKSTGNLRHFASSVADDAKTETHSSINTEKSGKTTPHSAVEQLELVRQMAASLHKKMYWNVPDNTFKVGEVSIDEYCRRIKVCLRDGVAAAREDLEFQVKLLSDLQAFEQREGA